LNKFIHSMHWQICYYGRSCWRDEVLRNETKEIRNCIFVEHTGFYTLETDRIFWQSDQNIWRVGSGQGHGLGIIGGERFYLCLLGICRHFCHLRPYFLLVWASIWILTVTLTLFLFAKSWFSVSFPISKEKRVSVCNFESLNVHSYPFVYTKASPWCLDFLSCFDPCWHFGLISMSEFWAVEL